MAVASALRVYHAFYHEAGGATRAAGSVRTPATKSNLIGNGRCSIETFVLAPGDEIVLWDGRTTGAIRDWSYLSVRIVGTGALHLGWFADLPISEANLSPAGTGERFLPDAMSCLTTLAKDNNRLYLNTTNNDLVGVAVDGLPTLWSDAGTALGKYYALYAKNPATATTGVTVERVVAE